MGVIDGLVVGVLVGVLVGSSSLGLSFGALEPPSAPPPPLPPKRLSTGNIIFATIPSPLSVSPGTKSSTEISPFRSIIRRKPK